MGRLAGATVIFDLDGTLVDTAPDIRVAANILMRENGLPELDIERVRGLIGQGARGLIVRAFQASGKRLDDDSLAALECRFIDVYGSAIARLSRPFPGVEVALDALTAAGAKLAICTNKRASLALKLLDELALAPHFAALATPETVGAVKPDPAHLLAAIEGAGGRPERAVMVGDSLSDARAARAAGVRLILVDFGYAEVPAAAMEPDVLIGHFSELPSAVARLLGAEAEAIGPSPALDA